MKSMDATFPSAINRNAIRKERIQDQVVRDRKTMTKVESAIMEGAYYNIRDLSLDVIIASLLMISPELREVYLAELVYFQNKELIRIMDNFGIAEDTLLTEKFKKEVLQEDGMEQ